MSTAADILNDELAISNFYKNKKILLIGGTGSVGEKILEKLLEYDPKVIRIYSRDEYKQYMIANKYAYAERRIRYLLGDIRDFERLQMATKGIDIVFNLAALKHVPACEYNPFEAVKTNVLGVQNIINAAINCGVSKVVLTSSDKAINPTNAMGATKLLGERLMIAAQSFKGSADICFSAVRFGNVLGSRGSVVPYFVNQIRETGKVTITNPEMTRFMMNLDGAVSLTIKAAALSKGGEIFVLKMPNIQISDLVDVVIELTCQKYGFNPSEIAIERIGLRPGEKMFEELMSEHEALNAYELDEMYVVIPENYKSSESFKDTPKAKLLNYSSHNADIIGKADVKNLIIKEGLI